MPKIYIDNKEYEVKEGKNLLEAVISLGLNLPYFCWHPQMGSVGACRQCAVKLFKDENDDKGKITIACLEEVKDGMRLSIEDLEASDFRSRVIESLMTNHPHDCPTCDEGGECHLQDMTVMTGHAYRSYRFNKRTHKNQYLGPLVNHEMNRCIACYRCVRFYKDYAGGKDLDVLSAHNHVYFGRQTDGVLESEFSGNLVEICPTGVFTDKTLKKHYTRKWDFTSAPSVCNLCSLGCNIIAGERYGEIRRVKSRYNYNVNGYFLCDRGRYGYEYMNSSARLKNPGIYDPGKKKVMNTDINGLLKGIGPLLAKKDNIIGIGSARASLESNFALKELVGDGRFYTGMSDLEYSLSARAVEIISQCPAEKYPLKKVEKSQCVLILGEDLTNTAPMMALAVRQAARQKPMKKIEKLNIREWDDKAVREAVQDEKGPVFSITPGPTKLDEICRKSIHLAPADIAGLGYAIAHYLDSNSPLPSNQPKETRDLAKEIAEVLDQEDDVAIISGTSCLDENVLNAASNIASARMAKGKKTGLCLTFPEANSHGLMLLGGKKLSELEQDKLGDKTAVIVENDLYRKMPGKDAGELLSAFGQVIVVDSLETPTAARANYLVPAAVITESDGHLVNNEGRVQRFYAVHVPDRVIQPSWRWIQAMADLSGNTSLSSNEFIIDFCRSIEKKYPVFKGLGELASHTDYRIGSQKIPRESHRFSGRTAIHANETIHEPQPPEDENSPMDFSMEGFEGHAPAPFNPRFWSPGWNSIQSLNKYQIETGGELHRQFPELCLFETAAKQKEKPDYYKPFDAGKKTQGDWKFLPLYHIYGSEELSVKEGGLRELMATPYVGLNPEDAEKKKWDEKTRVNLESGGVSLVLPVRIISQLPPGGAGIPVGIEGLPSSLFNNDMKITKI